MTQYPPPPWPPVPPGYLPYSQPAFGGPRRPGIVTALAIIGIIFGSVCLLCGPLSMLPFFTMTQLPTIKAIRDHHFSFVFMMIWLSMRILLGAVLLTASIGALNLKNWARKLFILYAVAGLIIYLGDLVQYFLWIVPYTSPAVQQINAPFAAARQFGQVFGMFLPIIYCICVIMVMKSRSVLDAFAANASPAYPPRWPPSPA